MTIVQPPPGFRGRHAASAPPPPIVWKCPACGVENNGPLEQGCTACGSGKPGTHLEWPKVQEQVEVNEVPTGLPPAADTSGVDEAFLRWKKNLGMPLTEPDGVLAYEAFRAGYMVGIAQVAETRVPLAGTAESRTIVAALRLFKENILPTASEEIASGEWLGIPEVDRLILRLERTGG